MGIGIEITDQSIFVVEVSHTGTALLIERMKTISLPPKAVVSGEIQDPDTVYDLLKRMLEEGGFSNQPIHMSIQSPRFLKRIFKVLNAATSNVESEIELKLSQSYLFSKEDFSFGFQPMVHVDTEHPIPDNIATPFMYIGMDKNKVDAAIDLVNTLEKDLLSLEHPSLSYLRTLTYNQNILAMDVLLCVTIHDSFIDISLIQDKFLLYTHIFHKESNYIIEDVFFHEEVAKRVNQVLMGYKNMYPKHPNPSTGIFFSHHYPYTPLFNYLTAYFSFISFRLFNWQTFQFSDSFSSRKDLNEEGLSEYIGAVGLAMKSFSSFLPISLIKIKRKLIAPLSRLESNIVITLGILILFLSIGGRFYLNFLNDKAQNQLEGVKVQLRSLQSGDYLSTQKKLVEQKSKLTYYDTLANTNSERSIKVMKTITQNLPADLSFSSVRIDKDNKVFIKGSSFYSDSIYKFYNQLKVSFDTANISGIDSLLSPETNVRENRFSIDFTWRLL